MITDNFFWMGWNKWMISTSDGKVFDEEYISFLWPFSKDEKRRIRLKWDKTLIIKVFGETSGYQYLLFKINPLWKPCVALQLIDLGSGFFVVKFMYSEDYEVVI